MANPAMVDHIQTIMSNPDTAAIATGGGAGGSAGAGADQTSATDPTGATNPNRSLDPFSQANQRRRSNIRHQILGFHPLSLASGGANQQATATPQVGFKGTRIVLSPLTIALGVTLASLLVGTVNQYAGNTLVPGDVYGPDSYGGRIDMTPCKAAISISSLVNSGLAGTFYGGIIGLVQGKPIRPQHSKVQTFGLSPQVIPGTSTVTFTYAPQLDLVPRLVALTPGTGFADNLIVNNVQCGQLLQTASSDPYPASLHSDLFGDISLDWDMISAAVSLQWTVTNPTAQSSVFQGVLYGDVAPSQLAVGA